ncbi:MAG: hypothetical protein AB1546_15550, partial [bacterium]
KIKEEISKLHEQISTKAQIIEHQRDQLFEDRHRSKGIIDEIQHVRSLIERMTQNSGINDLNKIAHPQ